MSVIEMCFVYALWT